MMEEIQECYNVVGGKHLINNQIWTVSLLRKKSDKGVQHAFLIIEGFKDNDYKIIRADLFIKGDAPLGSSAISGQSGLQASNYAGNASAKILPASSGECVILSSNVSGKATIVMKELMIDELKQSASECEYKSFGITAKQADQLLKAIAKDTGADLNYNLCGDGLVYSSSFLSHRYHSCTTWAIEKLSEIGIKVEGSWHDCIIVVTSKILPSAEQVGDKADNCLTM